MPRVIAACVHRLRYDAYAQAAGMYFVRMTSDDFAATRKLLLLK